MNIGIISEVLALNNRTGVGTYVYNLVNELNATDDANINFCFIKSVADKQLLPEIVIPNTIPKFKRYPWYLTLPRALKNADIDLVHNPTGIATYFKFKQKYILSVHDLTPLLYPETHPYGIVLHDKIFFPKTLLTADAIITGSNNTKNDIIEKFNIPPEKIQVIYYAAHPYFKPRPDEEIKRVKEKYGIDFPYILYVGTLEPRKNIITLLKAFSEMLKERTDVKLVIVGAKGWKYSGIFKFVNDYHLNNYIIFTDYVEHSDLPAIYSGAKVFVYPSLYEGFGIPPLEAMSCGCPVITSNVSSLPEVVDSAGILVDPLNYHELKDSILEVINDENLGKSLRTKGLSRAEFFSWKKCAQLTKEVYISFKR